MQPKLTIKLVNANHDQKTSIEEVCPAIPIHDFFKITENECTILINNVLDSLDEPSRTNFWKIIDRYREIGVDQAKILLKRLGKNDDRKDLNMLKSGRFVCFDLEWNSRIKYDPSRQLSEITEIAWIEFDHNNKLSEHSYIITDNNRNQVIMEFREVLSRVDGVIAHNISGDWAKLFSSENMWLKLGEYADVKQLCTMNACKNMVGVMQKNGKTMKQPRLEELYMYLHKGDVPPMVILHTAKDDTEILYQCVLKLREL
jgi:hypothetical protein